MSANTYALGMFVAGITAYAAMNLQLLGDKKGALFVAVPCVITSISGLAKAYMLPEVRFSCLVGAGLAAAGAGAAAVPPLLEEKSNKFEVVGPSCMSGLVLGCLGAGLIAPNGVVQIANPIVAPAVIAGIVRPDVQVVNPLFI